MKNLQPVSSKTEEVSLICFFSVVFLPVSTLVFLEWTWSFSFNSCDPPGMSVCAYVCLRVNAVSSSWSPSQFSSQWRLGGGRGESEPGHTHLIHGFDVYVPGFHPQLCDYSQRHRNSRLGSGVSGQICWPVKHHLGRIKSSDSWSSSHRSVCMKWWSRVLPSLWFNT